MKILLINPPSPEGTPFTREGRCMQKEGVWTTVWPPLSLCTIGAILRDAGFEVKISDCPSEGIDNEGLQAILTEFKPDLLVIDTATPTIIHDLKVPALAKSVLPQVKTAVFGIHVGVLPEQTFDISTELDFIIRGEPEFSVLEIARRMEQGEDFQETAGISLRENGVVKHFQDRQLCRELDKLPIPAWDLVDVKHYRLPFNRRKFLMVMSSRGCPYDCTFCVAQQYYGKKIRKRSPQRIADEIECCMEEFGVYDFFFWSESFTIIKKNIHELCDEILQRRLKIKWVCNSRADNIDEQLLNKMKRAGCWMISFGIESGDQDILDRSKKKITLEQIQHAVKLTHDAGFQIAGHFVLGLPGETEETLRKTAEFSRKLDLDYAQFYCAAPWPGSRLYDEAVKEGWLATNDWKLFEQSYCVLEYPQISGRRIMELRDKITYSFYFRPKIIWKTLKKIGSPAEFRSFLGMVSDYVFFHKR